MRPFRTILLVGTSAALLLGPTAFGQEASPAPSAPSAPTAPSAPSTGATNPGRQPTSPTVPGREQSPFPADIPRPIFLQGKVILDDGTVPPEPVVIERVCNGTPRPEGYTDSKGRFSFELGRNQGMMMDASTSNGDDGFGGSPFPGRNTNSGGLGGMRSTGMSTREMQLSGCELRANLMGFRSDIVQLGMRRSLDNPDVGTIVLHRLAKVEGFTFSMTTAMAPKDAKKAYEKGLELAKKKKLPEAQKELEKATSLYPKYAVAWYELGRIYEAAQQTEPATKAFEASVAADSKYVNPYLHLSLLYGRDKSWEKAAEASAKAIKLNPISFPQVYYYNAVANFNLKKLEEAEKSAATASEMDPKRKSPRILYLLGSIQIEQQKYKEGMATLQEYLKYDPQAPEAADVQKQVDQIQKALAEQNQ